VQDGIVESFSLKQEAAVARLSIRFAEKGLKWRARELSDPRRVALDVYAQGVEPETETETAEKIDIAPSKAKTTTTELPKKEPAVRAATDKKKRRLVVIDAGHGGKDPGATGRRGTKEKDVNLAAALELASVLRERGDFDVLLTRDSDEFVPLSARSELANEKEADLFVSLHCNAASDRREKGWEVYSVSETASDPEAEKLAAAENAALAYEGKDVQEEMAKMILLAMTKTEMINESAAFSALTAKSLTRRMDIEARGAKQAGFYVLRGTHAPAILVEMAFVSHAEDEAKLASRRFRRAMAEGVAAGIADYARRQGWLE
jgi:N-acetylmuramoyl-L-alanine amidase